MPKILVVDDEAVLVKGIKFNLENEGYQVETGCDGEEAVDKARTGRFDLIYPSHGRFPVKKELISRLVSQTAKLERGELAATETQFHGIPLKRYDADAAVFLCDADYGQDGRKEG